MEQVIEDLKQRKQGLAEQAAALQRHLEQVHGALAYVTQLLDDYEKGELLLTPPAK